MALLGIIIVKTCKVCQSITWDLRNYCFFQSFLVFNLF